MTTEQREAIEICKNINPGMIYFAKDRECEEYASAIKTVLSLIKEQGEEIGLYKEELDSIYKALNIERGVARPNTSEIIQALKDTIRSQAKQIDLMAERINWLCKTARILLDKEHGVNFNEEDIKQYFANKVNSSEQ